MARIPIALVQWPDFSLIGRVDVSFVTCLGVFTAVLVTFSARLSDFFGHDGDHHRGRAGGMRPARRLPGVNPVVLVDSLGAAPGGYASSSSNTTYIESRPASPRAEGPA